MSNRLFYGDNLKVLRESVKDESVDLVYLDPPFNSNRSYNVLFKHKDGDAAQGQIEAFDDTWTWSQDSERLYDEMVAGSVPAKVADAIIAMRKLLGENDVLAYLVMMTARLVELHRVLKPTGSLYLHCDPTASHYLKITLDAIFGPTNFISEVIWKRTTAHNSAKRYGPVHDVVLYYGKDSSKVVWNQQHQPYDQKYIDTKYRYRSETGQRYRLSDMTGPGVRQGDSGLPWRGYDPSAGGRHWQPPSYCYWKYEKVTGKDLAQFPLIERLEELDRIGLVYWPDKEGGRPEHKRYLDDMPGVPLQDVWTDVDPINARAAERLHYPTQKPLALLERILQASSNPGDLVLDPFCGCGTTIDAAQKLGRSWIGIDITYLAIDLITKRLRTTYGDEVRDTYELSGVPRELEAAQALFTHNAFDFERWAVSLVNGQPNEKQVGDKGIDGVVRFYLNEKKELGEALVSVKGGHQLNPAMVRDLRGTIERHKAALGIFICLGKPTKGMIEEADHSGSYEYEFSGAKYPRIQILTIAELLAGKRPEMPTPIMPYKLAKKRSGQLSMLDG